MVGGGVCAEAGVSIVGQEQLCNCGVAVKASRMQGRVSVPTLRNKCTNGSAQTISCTNYFMK